MTNRATFTQAELQRAMKAARAVDPRAVVEVTRDGAIRILPADSPPASSEVDDWFAQNGKG